MAAARDSHAMNAFFRLHLRQLFLLVTLFAILAALVGSRFRQAQSDQRAQRLNQRLVRAAAVGDHPSVAAAIRAGAALDVMDMHSQTPVYYALDRRDAALLDTLLSAGADPNFGFGSKVTLPLGLAIERNEVELAERLLRAGATLEPQRIPAVKLWQATGDPAMLEVLLSHGLKLGEVSWRQSDALDHKLKVARLLLEHGALPESSQAPSRPIDMAVRSAEPELADLLRNFGASYTAREAAAFNRLDELKQMLHADPDLLQQRFPPYWGGIQPEHHPTLLGIALAHGHRELATFLIDSGAPLHEREEYETTLMVQAVKGGDPELVRLLAWRCLSVNAPGDFTLRTAIWGAHSQAAIALIELGADVHAVHAGTGTPLHSAVRANAPEIIRCLLDAGSDPSMKNEKGQTALDLARELQHDAAKLELERH